MSRRMQFDSLEPVQVPVTLGSQKFILMEADESAHIAYNSAVMKGARVVEGADGKTRIEDLSSTSEVEAVLVSRCLYYAVNVSQEKPDGELPIDVNGQPDRSKLVPLERILSMPGPRIVGKLYQEVREISGMNAPVRGKPEDKHTCPHCSQEFTVAEEVRKADGDLRKN